MRLILVRHGHTKANLEKRYIGATDDPLCEKGREELLKRKRQGIYPNADLLYVSPMKRCMETADIIYPGMEKQIIAEFSECDFGIFEGKNYMELSKMREYQEWIDSMGETGFPEGESRKEFSKRCREGFCKVIKQVMEGNGINSTIACIIHGGTIMSILDEFAEENRSYFDYQCANGEGYLCEVGKNGEEIYVYEILPLGVRQC